MVRHHAEPGRGRTTGAPNRTLIWAATNRSAAIDGTAGVKATVATGLGVARIGPADAESATETVTVSTW
jgi:hypothetical protein